MSVHESDSKTRKVMLMAKKKGGRARAGVLRAHCSRRSRSAPAGEVGGPLLGLAVFSELSAQIQRARSRSDGHGAVLVDMANLHLAHQMLDSGLGRES